MIKSVYIHNVLTKGTRGEISVWEMAEIPGQLTVS